MADCHHVVAFKQVVLENLTDNINTFLRIYEEKVASKEIWALLAIKMPSNSKQSMLLQYIKVCLKVNSNMGKCVHVSIIACITDNGTHFCSTGKFTQQQL